MSNLPLRYVNDCLATANAAGKSLRGQVRNNIAVTPDSCDDAELSA